MVHKAAVTKNTRLPNQSHVTLSTEQALIHHAKTIGPSRIQKLVGNRTLKQTVLAVTRDDSPKNGESWTLVEDDTSLAETKADQNLEEGGSTQGGGAERKSHNARPTIPPIGKYCHVSILMSVHSRRGNLPSSNVLDITLPNENGFSSIECQ